MNGLPRGQRRSAAQEIAACSVMTAILIAGQAVFAQISGIEIVTVLLLTFFLAAHGLEVRSQIVCHAFCIHSAHGIRHRPGPPGYRAVPLLRRDACAHSPSVSSPRR